MNMTPDNPQEHTPSDPQSVPSSDAEATDSVSHLSDETAHPASTVISETTQVHIRRAPKYANIMVSGAVLGLIIAFIFAIVFDDPEVTDTTWQQAFGFLFVPTVGVSIAVFGIVALVLDRRSRKRERLIAAEHLHHVEESVSPEVTEQTIDGEDASHDRHIDDQQDDHGSPDTESNGKTEG